MREMLDPEDMFGPTPPDYEGFYKDAGFIVGGGFLAILVIGFITSKSTVK
jgi:hypothetical protein